MPSKVLVAFLAIACCGAAQQAAPVDIQFASGGVQVHGRVFAASGPGLKPTVLMVPGFPGNPYDVVGIGSELQAVGINMVMFNPRGMHASEGSFGFNNTLADIDAALAWIGRAEIRERFHIDASAIVLGGHSFGGGMTAIYAARHPAIRRWISIAGADIGVTARNLATDPSVAESYRQSFTTPGAVVRVKDIDAAVEELRNPAASLWLKDQASALVDRSALLIGGSDDALVGLEDTVRPFYQQLKAAGARDATLLVYDDGHQFGSVGKQMAQDIKQWLSRASKP